MGSSCWISGETAMRLSGRQIGLLKEYMHDLVEQAKQDEATAMVFGYASKSYRPDQAISDLLAILDDRIESEGVQVGLSVEFLHQMWMLCNESKSKIENSIWLQRNLNEETSTKSWVRDLTYRKLIDYLEHLPEEPSTACQDE